MFKKLIKTRFIPAPVDWDNEDDVSMRMIATSTYFASLEKMIKNRMAAKSSDFVNTEDKAIKQVLVELDDLLLAMRSYIPSEEEEYAEKHSAFETYI
jgi:hypothetical protein